MAELDASLAADDGVAALAGRLVLDRAQLGVVGLYVPFDPGVPNEDAAEGKLLFEVGKFFEKGQTMGTGQADVKSYNRQLRDLIIAGTVEPGFIVSKEIPLAEATDAYKKFDDREDGYSKALFHP